MRFIAKTLEGLESVLAEEIAQIGGENISILKRAVSYEGDKIIMYKSNLMLRTALRILVYMDEFDIRDEKDLYEKVKAYRWEQYFSVADTFAIDSVVHSDKFRHANYIALKCKDAIVDRFRERSGSRPSVDVDNPTLRINIHVRQHTVTLSLDSSGRSLHMRGYRKSQVDAPLNEVMAAGLLLLAGWKTEQKLLDPMCGSGTILCEAAYLALGITPQQKDRHFALEKWMNFDDDLWAQVKEDAYTIKNHQPFDITGSDINPKAISISRDNIETAGLTQYIKLEEEDFFYLDHMQETILIFNPPYDGRLKENDIIQFYKFIGDKLKQSCKNCSAWILSGHIEAIKNLGLRPSRRIQMINGSIPSVFCQFEIYEGSKKAKYQENAQNQS
jgi:putative N6-adenine-specific DNA methylase